MSVTLNQLFESKVHIGHLTRYWNPKMEPFIFGKRNGMHQIDLDKTQACLEQALNFLMDLGSRRGSKVLFVGTKRVAQSIIKEQAMRAGMPYVDQYWRGGNLTNFQTSSQSAKVLKEMEATYHLENFGVGRTKKEIRNFERRLAHLEKGVGGIKDMIGLPDALFVVDIGEDKIAVTEAQALHIPIIGVVDTNHSPEGIDYVIPGNDDAIASIRLYTTLAADAILAGRRLIQDTSPVESTPQPIIKRVKRSEAAKSTLASVSQESTEEIRNTTITSDDKDQLSNETEGKVTDE